MINSSGKGRPSRRLFDVCFASVRRFRTLFVLASGMLWQQSAQAAISVPLYGVFEADVTCAATMDNPFRDAVLTVDFHAPSGAVVPVTGFYAGGESWRVRFVPREPGAWTWQATLRTPGQTLSKQGTFACEGRAGHGFLRISPRNTRRFEFEDGTPFYPIGIQTCNFLKPDSAVPNRAA